MRKILLWILEIFRPFRAVLLPPTCRFRPTCSEYAVEALKSHELPQALSMILRRVARCRPFGPAGYDPVTPPSL